MTDTSPEDGASAANLDSLVAAPVTGLDADEQRMLNALRAQLRDKANRNEVRSQYLDLRRAARTLGPMLPPYLQELPAVLGWPTKACEAVARRTRLEGFDLLGGDLSDYGIDELIDGNNYLRDVRLGEYASLTHAVAWEIVTAGGPGEPDALITQKSATDGTGLWNPRTRRLDAFLSVIDRDDQGIPSTFNLYLPGETVMVDHGTVQDRTTHQLWVPVEPVVYRPDLERPFGRSRVSRAVMYLTDAAMRVLLRMEGNADFYASPRLLLLGATLEQMQGPNGSKKSAWTFLQSAVNGLPDDDGAENPRAQVFQMQQGSQQPHLQHLDTIAAAFAGETGIPVSSLGVGVQQANPTSADSYVASREDLIAESEDAADSWGWAHVRTMQNAYLIASGDAELPPELRKLRPVWRDPRQTSRASAADASVKLLGAMPQLGNSPAFVETLGFGADLTERIQADMARANNRASIGALLNRPAPTVTQAGDDGDTVAS